MTDGQIYCTESEVIADLSLQGTESQLYGRIQTASQYILQNVGVFVPIWESRTYYGDTRLDDLQVEPLLSIDTLTVNDATQSSDDWDLNPPNKYWRNGPYTRLYSEVIAWDETVISGSWGLFNLSESIGINGTQSTTSETTITVANGAKLSPGMCIKLGSEQELAISTGSGTLCTSTVNETLTASDEEINITTGSEINEGEVIQIETEDIYVRKVRTNTLVCARGWNSTTKAAHASTTAIYVYRTYNVTRGVNGTTAATHSNMTINRVLVPADVNYLCRQMVALMRMKAATGFLGRMGGGDGGEAWYVNELPEGVIKKISDNYRIIRI
jgi:hypothetical protein